MIPVEPESAPVAKFVRQITHDLRNALNGMDLESAFLQEVVTDEEGTESIKRLRRQVRGMADQLRNLSQIFREPEPVASLLTAQDLLTIWRQQHDEKATELDFDWQSNASEDRVLADATMLAVVLRELLVNAVAFCDGSLAEVRVRREGEDVVLELRERKAQPVNPSGWGEMFSTTKRGGYGLGLWRARRFVAANHGTLTQQFQATAGVLETVIKFPVA